MSETTFDATALRNALLNVEPHAAHADHLPVLEAVRLECDGTTLTLITTDRYVMAVESVPTVEAGAAFTTLVALKDVARLVTLTKGAPRNVTHWPTTITLEGNQLTVTVPGQTMTCRTVDGEFPRWRSIFDGAVEATSNDENTIAHAAYDPKLIAKFAKVTEGGRKAKVMRMHFSAPTKPAFIEIGETFRAVLMPQRVDWPTPAAQRIAS